MSSGKRLYEASKRGDLDKVRQILSSTEELVYVDYRGEYDHTPLIRASENGHTAVVEELLDNDANINARNHIGQTALHRASAEGHDTCVSLLLHHKDTIVNIRDDSGDTPLHSACSNFKLRVVSLLEKAGAKTNSQNNSKQFPINALLQDQIEAKQVRKLLDEIYTDNKSPLLKSDNASAKSSAIYDNASAKSSTISDNESDESSAISDNASDESSSVGVTSRTDSALLGVTELPAEPCKLTMSEHEYYIKGLSFGIRLLESTMIASIAKLKKKIEEKDATVHDLETLVESLEFELRIKSEAVKEHIDCLVQRTKEHYLSIKKDVPEVVLFEFFDTIADKLQYEQSKWYHLGQVLFKNFPDEVRTPFLNEIQNNNSTEKDRCLELLFQWKFYNSKKLDRSTTQELKDALKEVIKTEALAQEICTTFEEEMIKHEQKHLQNKGSLTNIGLSDLAGRIGLEWHTLGLYLGFSRPELDQIKIDNPTARDRTFAMLEKWRNREAVHTYMRIGRLSEALIKCDRSDLANELNYKDNIVN